MKKLDRNNPKHHGTFDDIDSFKLIHKEGRLRVEIHVEDRCFKGDITEYMEGETGLDDWLDYKLGL